MRQEECYYLPPELDPEDELLQKDEGYKPWKWFGAGNPQQKEPPSGQTKACKH